MLRLVYLAGLSLVLAAGPAIGAETLAEEEVWLRGPAPWQPDGAKPRAGADETVSHCRLEDLERDLVEPQAGRQDADIGGAVVTALRHIMPWDLGADHDLDLLCQRQALETLPDRRTFVWTSEDDGSVREFTPRLTFRGEDGRFCRLVAETRVGDQGEERLYSRACRDPDGAWHVSPLERAG